MAQHRSLGKVAGIVDIATIAIHIVQFIRLGMTLALIVVPRVAVVVWDSQANIMVPWQSRIRPRH